MRAVTLLGLTGRVGGLSNGSMRRPLDAESVDVGVYAGGRREGRSYRTSVNGCEFERALSQGRERGALGKVGKSQKATGAGKEGSLRVVWKLLAGIEDGFDNGWPLIRADAGSLFIF